MIRFSAVDIEWESQAYAWHADFVEHEKSIYPRTPEEFHGFVTRGMAWSALDERGEILGLAYATREPEAWEVGGLAVTIQARKRGVGLHLSYLTLGHLLFEEDPLADDPPRPVRVIVHVLQSNEQPRAIVERILGFRAVGPVRIEANKLPGLPSEDDGFVHGYEYELTAPTTLEVLSEWADGWDDRLHTGEPAYIELRDGITLTLWAEAFRLMVNSPALARGPEAPSRS